MALVKQEHWQLATAIVNDSRFNGGDAVLLVARAIADAEERGRLISRDVTTKVQ
jgi:hypothetical protein